MIIHNITLQGIDLLSSSDNNTSSTCKHHTNNSPFFPHRYPHPPQFLNWMRKVIFSDICADTFITQAISEGLKGHYTGYNLDWEPTASNTTAPVTQFDATKYAQFIDRFSDALHKHNMRLTVDVATWVTQPDGNGPSVWDYTAIASTDVDKAISMGTYTSNDVSFDNQLSLLINAFGTSRGGIGLQTVNASTSEPISAEEVQVSISINLS